MLIWVTSSVLFFTGCFQFALHTKYGYGTVWKQCCCWVSCDTSLVSVSFAGGRSGSLQSLILLNCLSEYLTFSFRWKPSRVPTQACSLTTLTLHWDTWMALHFTLSPLYTHSLSFISTFSLLFQEVYYSEIFKIISSVHWLWAIFVPLPFLIIPYVAADVNMDLNGKFVCFHK